MRLFAAAVVIHVSFIIFLTLANHLVGGQRHSAPPERLQVRLIEVPVAPAKPPLPEELPAVEGAIEPDFAPKSLERTPAQPPQRPRVEQPLKVSGEQPPDALVTKTPRRIVGLNLESTVTGPGPSFATGTSRRGQTEGRAQAQPSASARLESAGAAADGEQPSGTRQRTAAHIPTRDVQFVKPTRQLHNKPAYPARLKAQGIEGDVTVRVDIDVTGRVIRVSVLSGSGYPEFDEAARRAALAERFTPAKRRGQPVPFSLSYAYRFRIQDF
jgi:protein TonB